jgi:hypothetical protein
MTTKLLIDNCDIYYEHINDYKSAYSQLGQLFSFN